MTLGTWTGCIGRVVTVMLVAILLPAAAGWGQAPLRVAVLSDTHVTSDPANASYGEHFRQAIREVNEAKVDVVLIAGDLADGGKEEQLQQARSMAAELNPKPYLVAGNHDVGGVATKDKPGPSQKRLDLFAKIIGPHFYTADLPHGLRLVALDSSLFGSGNPLEQEQWKLLEKELGPDVPARSRIVLMHYPPFVNTPDEADGYMSLNGPERQRFLKLLEGGKAAVVITGHQHLPRERTSGDTKILTAPPISFGLPRGKQPVGWMLVELGDGGSVRSELRYLDGAAEDAQPSTRVHIFYYPWYGAPPFEKEYVHWTQAGHTPPQDIASSFYPSLGAYSSADPKVLAQHMQWIRQAHAGVLAVSWWGQNSYEDQKVPAVLDAAAAAGLKVTFHLEPYHEFTPAKLVDDVQYLLKHYGRHPAFYRSAELGGKPVFYNFETLRHPAQQWRQALDRLHAEVEPVVILAQTSDLGFIEAAGFDGGYPYDVLTPFRDASFLRDWTATIAPRFASTGKLFVPSVGPGYTDERAVHGRKTPTPESARTRDGGQATTYDAAWRAAIATGAPLVTVTSFNEWHEGSQIEPARAAEAPGYSYPAYPQGELQYLKQTARWVDEFGRSPAVKQGGKPVSPQQSSRRGAYLKDSRVDFTSLLPPPPVEGSAQEASEIQELLKLQGLRTAEQARQCKRDEAFMPFTFAEVLGPSFNPDDLPVTAKFLNQVLKDLNSVSEAAKRSFDRRRPYLVDARVQPCINRVNSKSYPSGHSVRGTVLAAVVAEIYPEQRDALLALGRRIGDSRVLGGVHFPSDVEAGRTLGKAIVEEMRKNPQFAVDLAKAKDECRGRTAAPAQSAPAPAPARAAQPRRQVENVGGR